MTKHSYASTQYYRTGSRRTPYGICNEIDVLCAQRAFERSVRVQPEACGCYVPYRTSDDYSYPSAAIDGHIASIARRSVPYSYCVHCCSRGLTTIVRVRVR